MLSTPTWIVKLLEAEDFRCPHCNAAFKPECIKACGIRTSFRKTTDQVLYIEYHCPACRKQPTALEMSEITFADFAHSILCEIPAGAADAIQRGKHAAEVEDLRVMRARAQQSLTPISKQEVVSVKNLLRQCKSHVEFLLAIGMSPDEVESD